MDEKIYMGVLLVRDIGTLKATITEYFLREKESLGRLKTTNNIVKRGNMSYREKTKSSGGQTVHWSSCHKCNN
jgi:hypothetical protein